MSTDPSHAPDGGSQLAWLPLLLALLICVLITLDPRLLARSDGSADHTAASLLCWAMSAGFVRGVGYIPRHGLPRLLLSRSACVLATCLGLIKLLS